MTYTIRQDIVVPLNFVKDQMGLVPPFRQDHFHSTGNPISSVQNERDYLAGHYAGANYTHLVGITNGQVDIRQVMNTNGGAYDVGGDWNWETWSAIEFVEGSIKSQDDFNKAYKAYVWLGRYLAQQAGIPITIDTPDIAGLKTHNYASKTGHGSDHIDPIQFLEKWGVSYDQFKKDVLNGLPDSNNVTPATNTNKNGEKDMLLFKADKDTKYGSAGTVFLQVGGKVIHVESGTTFDNLKAQGVPFAVMTIRNTEQLINAFGGVQ